MIVPRDRQTLASNNGFTWGNSQSYKVEFYTKLELSTKTYNRVHVL